MVFKQLQSEIKSMLALRSPTESDVKETMEPMEFDKLCLIDGYANLMCDDNYLVSFGDGDDTAGALAPRAAADDGNRGTEKVTVARLGCDLVSVGLGRADRRRKTPGSGP
ncbi:hypothetical protein NL676_033183 [Syzygium grande]|nr:hypothetical protein NL676_033183 [Syzygium grande]